MSKRRFVTARRKAGSGKLAGRVIANKGVNNSWLDSDIALMTRDSVRQFARAEVSPVAERVHRHDEIDSRARSSNKWQS